MPKLPKWVPLNPGCGCLILLAVIIIAVMLIADAH
jgi:hypothetical protein